MPHAISQSEAGVPTLSTNINQLPNRGLERVEEPLGDRDVCRLVASAEAHAGRAEPRQLHDDPVAVGPEEGVGGRLDERRPDAARPSADHRERLPLGARHRPVAALDDRCLLARDQRDRRLDRLNSATNRREWSLHRDTLTWRETVRRPDTDPTAVRFTELREWVMALPGFDDDPKGSNEPKLEAIQMAWYEEFKDAAGS